MYQNCNNFPYFALGEVIKDDKIDREKGLFGLGCLSFAVKYLYVHSHFSMQWDIFITLIVSCTNTTIIPGNLNFILSAGVEVYSIPSKFQTDCSCKS